MSKGGLLLIGGVAVAGIAGFLVFNKIRTAEAVATANATSAGTLTSDEKAALPSVIR